MNLKEKLYRFMQGRYGTDQLGRATIAAALICMVASIFIRPYLIRSIVDYTGMALLIYSYYRAFSRNYAKRSGENQKYLQKTQKIRHWFGSQKYMMEQKKQYRIYNCPECRQKIRVPKGRGKIEISCPKCRHQFIRRS